MTIRITWIDKDNGDHENPYTAISRLGWKEDESGKEGWLARVALYDWINGGGSAYVQDVLGNKAKVMTAVTSRMTKYVHTRKDQVTSDNLLKLPEPKGR